MNILVGLGNPGREYQDTRHNSGWQLLDFIAQEHRLGSFQMEKKLHAEISKSNTLLLAKPQTFMNESGKAVKAILNWHNASSETEGSSSRFPNLFIVYDDLDLELGHYKIQFDSGPKIHNGLNSIRQQLNTNEFWNVRIGVDGRGGDRTLPGHVYVLQKFKDEEKGLFEETLKKISADLETKMNV